MNIKKYTIIFLILLTTGACNNLATNHLHTVCSSPSFRPGVAQFLDNVLKVVPSRDFFSLIDRTRHIHPQNLYHILMHRIDRVLPWNRSYRLYKAIQEQKIILSQQATQLIKNRTKIDGCIEIGSPGTYISGIANLMPINGPIYVVNDQQKMTDYAQAFSFSVHKKFLPYDHFIPINNYCPFDEKTVASDSVDLVICFIGFHHIPLEKLDNFIASIHRVLRPGGILLLREHDCSTPELTTLVHGIHSIFNVVVGGVSEAQERAEYRNFKPVTYWSELMAKHGFIVGTQTLFQHGDPSRNAMIKYQKPAVIHKNTIQTIATEIKKNPNYTRNLKQTYLTSPEWVNVDMSQEYGSFINHTPFYEFPYWQNTKAYWHVFAQSWKSAAKKESHFNILTSSYTQMNLFIGVMMSVEAIVKETISAPIRFMFAGTEDGTIQLLIQDPDNRVATLKPSIRIVRTFPDQKALLIEVPRYKKFVDFMMHIAKTNITIIEIAGQKEIQYKVRVKKNAKNILDNLTPGCVKEYEWTLPTQPDYIYCALTVTISAMQKVNKFLHAHDVELLHIHDY